MPSISKPGRVGPIAITHTIRSPGLPAETPAHGRTPRTPQTDDYAMNVSELMTREPICIGPDDSVEVAVQLLRRRGIRHLLVVKKDRLVGIISDRDIKRALDPQKTRKRV